MNILNGLKGMMERFTTPVTTNEVEGNSPSVASQILQDSTSLAPAFGVNLSPEGLLASRQSLPEEESLSASTL